MVKNKKNLFVLLIIFVLILICCVYFNTTKKDNSDYKVDYLNEENSSIDFEDNSFLNNLPGYINGAKQNEEQIVCGIELPFSIPDTPLVIEGIGQYTGPYIEDGKDEPVANALALVIRNTSDTMVEFGEIDFNLNNGTEAVFQVSTLPAGKGALILEKNNLEFNRDSILTFTDKMYAEKEDLSLLGDKVKINAEDKTLFVENLTKEDLGTVYVRYKQKINDDIYLGGITYSCKVEGMTAKASKEVKTQHFSKKGSQIVMVETVKK